MNIINLIYTKRIESKNVEELLKSKYGFSLLKKDGKKRIYIEALNETSIKVDKNTIEIMYHENNLNQIISIIENLSTYNQGHTLSIKVYGKKVRDSIMQLLTVRKYYWV